jgi:hypothetical protein
MADNFSIDDQGNVHFRVAARDLVIPAVNFVGKSEAQISEMIMSRVERINAFEKSRAEDRGTARQARQLMSANAPGSTAYEAGNALLTIARVNEKSDREGAVVSAGDVAAKAAAKARLKELMAEEAAQQGEKAAFNQRAELARITYMKTRSPEDRALYEQASHQAWLKRTMPANYATAPNAYGGRIVRPGLPAGANLPAASTAGPGLRVGMSVYETLGALDESQPVKDTSVKVLEQSTLPAMPAAPGCAWKKWLLVALGIGAAAWLLAKRNKKRRK